MGRAIMEFLVKDVPEEYFIISRRCCPKCKTPALERILQELLELKEFPQTLRNAGASGKADRLTVKCKNCGFKLVLLFHLHTSYIKRLSEIARRLLRTLKDTD